MVSNKLISEITLPYAPYAGVLSVIEILRQLILAGRLGLVERYTHRAQIVLFVVFQKSEMGILQQLTAKKPRFLSRIRTVAIREANL